MNLKLRWVAVLREERGVASEQVEWTGGALALYQDLRHRHGLGLPPERVLLSVNECFVPWDHPLAEGDELIFLPPMAGG